MEWDKIAKATNDLYKQRAQTLLATLQQETEALEGHDDCSEEKYIAARGAMGGSEAIEAFRPQYEAAARAIKAIRESLVPSWIAFQSLTITHLYSHCLHAQVVFKHTIDNLIAELAKKGIHTVLSAPDSLKKMERAIVKMEIKYGGDVSRLTDVFRCTLIFDSLKDLYLAVQFIAVSPNLRGPAGAVVTDIEDRFLNPLPKQYGDVLLQIVIDGIPGELQLNVRAMYDAKTTGGGHASYRVQRFANEYLLWSVMHDTPVFTLALLRDHGADPNIIRDKNGLTALHFACHSGKQKTVEVLLGHGAQPLVLTLSKQLALEFALHNRHWAVAETVATAISRVAEAGIKDEEFVALERSLKVAEQQWNTQVDTSTAAKAKSNMVKGLLAKTLMRLLTLPSDVEALHSFTKYYTLPQVVSVYVITNNISTPDTDPLVRRARAKEALLQVVRRGKPLRDDVISAIVQYVKRGFLKTDGLMKLAMTIVDTISAVKYEPCRKGVNVKKTENLRNALIGCVDPQGTVTLCARGLDPHTKRYRAGKCGLSRLGCTFGACFVFNGFKQRVDEYEILTCNPAHLLWLPVTLGQQVPVGSIVVDDNGARRTYHARAKIKVLNEGVISKLYKLTKGLKASNTISNKDGFVPGEAVAVDDILTACVVPYGTAAMKHVEFEILVFQREESCECDAVREQRTMRKMLSIHKSPTSPR